MHFQLLMKERTVRQTGQCIVAGGMGQMTGESVEIHMSSFQQLIMPAEEADQDQTKQEQTKRQAREDPVQAIELLLILGILSLPRICA
jgi:hypothetical protein